MHNAGAKISKIQKIKINFTKKIREIDFTKKLQKNGLSVFIIIDKMGETHEVVIMREISPFVVFQLFQFEN